MGPIATSSAETGISQSAQWQETDQLSRILASSWFRTSSRCSQLLRHVVGLTLNGQTDRLRERQIAIDAFHRKPTYDNNSDPVVRVAAGEVRKRLAQYYGNPESAGEIRIELPIGSYVPIFHYSDRQEPLPKAERPAASPEQKLNSETDAVPTAAETQRELQAKPLLSRRSIVLGVVALLVLAAAAVGVWRESRPVTAPSGFEAFWAPVIASPEKPLISVGELRARELSFVPNPQRGHQTDGFTIAANKDDPQGIPVERMAYSQAAVRVASLLAARNKTFDVFDQSDTTFADFSGRPTILIGSYDNDWAMGVSQGRRFQFQSDIPRGLIWIADRGKPGEEIGVLNISSPEPTSYDAFSIVMRVTGQLSQQPHILLAGIGPKGTSAAAEFASNPKYLNDFARRAPWILAGKNVEFLIRTRVIENVIGIPTIVDYEVW